MNHVFCVMFQLLSQALRVSMEEQRQRHEDETQKVQMASLNESLATQTAATDTNVSMDTNESALARAEAAVLPVSNTAMLYRSLC